jgi:hypothetical protein
MNHLMNKFESQKVLVHEVFVDSKFSVLSLCIELPLTKK